MKYLHRFHSTAELNQFYNSTGTPVNAVESLVINYNENNITVYYRGKLSTPPDPSQPGYIHSFTSEDAQIQVVAESPWPGYVLDTQLDDWLTVLQINQASEPTPGLYIEPFIGVVDGQSQPVFNRTQTPVAVDLGLPSGLLWADRNLGATSPEDFGYYFAWGETSPKSTYTWSNYKFGNSVNSLSKYNSMDKYRLDSCDDPATIMLGPKWRMPTPAECNELFRGSHNDNLPWKFSIEGINGILGMGIKSNVTGNSLFFPQGGSMSDDTLEYLNQYGHYWTSEINEPGHPVLLGWCHPAYPEASPFDNSYTCERGMLIRPVYVPDNYVPYTDDELR